MYITWCTLVLQREWMEGMIASNDSTHWYYTNLIYAQFQGKVPLCLGVACRRWREEVRKVWGGGERERVVIWTKETIILIKLTSFSSNRSSGRVHNGSSFQSGVHMHRDMDIYIYMLTCTHTSCISVQQSKVRTNHGTHMYIVHSHVLAFCTQLCVHRSCD